MSLLPPDWKPWWVGASLIHSVPLLNSTLLEFQQSSGELHEAWLAGQSCRQYSDPNPVCCPPAVDLLGLQSNGKEGDGQGVGVCSHWGRFLSKAKMERPFQENWSNLLVVQMKIWRQ